LTGRNPWISPRLGRGSSLGIKRGCNQPDECLVGLKLSLSSGLTARKTLLEVIQTVRQFEPMQIVSQVLLQDFIQRRS
jgi:hypothetical protein